MTSCCASAVLDDLRISFLGSCLKAVCKESFVSEGSSAHVCAVKELQQKDTVLFKLDKEGFFVVLDRAIFGECHHSSQELYLEEDPSFRA